MTDYQEVRTTNQESGGRQRFYTFKATQLIWLGLGLIETMIALRVFFKLIAVNAANPFASFLYSVTDLFVGAFAGLTGSWVAGNSVLEVSSIIAMLVYLLIAWGIERLVYVAFYRPRGPVSRRQTVVSQHIPEQQPVVASHTMTTNRTTTDAPVLGVGHTTVTERTSTQTPESLL